MTLVWDENGSRVPADVHPGGIRATIGEVLARQGIRCRLAHQDESDSGLSDSALEDCRALVWWGHGKHDLVPRDRIMAVAERVRQGRLGLVLVHSAHQSLIAKELLGAKVYSKGGWDDELQPEQVRICAPEHPVCEGVEDFVIDDEEFYGAPATFPPPQVVLAQSRFPRFDRYYPFGLVWTVGEGRREIVRSGPGKGQGEGDGAGRIVYLRPGHETSSSLRHPMVARLLANAVLWVRGD